MEVDLSPCKRAATAPFVFDNILVCSRYLTRRLVNKIDAVARSHGLSSRARPDPGVALRCTPEGFTLAPASQAEEAFFLLATCPILSGFIVLLPVSNARARLDNRAALDTAPVFAPRVLFPHPLLR